MPSLALIGYPLSHSFSKVYFEEKFSQLSLLNWRYELLPSVNLAQLIEDIMKREDMVGFNVTIPHKINIIPYCCKLSEEAEAIGAVNCVKIDRRGGEVELLGFNTDVDGFEKSLTNWYKSAMGKAIVYGNGGAAKAVLYVLKKLNIDFIQVVRHVKNKKQIHLDEVNKTMFAEHDLIINCTPIGMYPQINEYLNINNDWIKPAHYYYDLVYNPMETATMKLFSQHGARVKGGLEMLHLQADKAWEIWTK